MNQKIKSYPKLEGSSMKLDEILKMQRAPNIKFILVFEHGESSNEPKLNIVREKNKSRYEKNGESSNESIFSFLDTILNAILMVIIC